MVAKKKGAKTVEVADGWEGRIIPLELVEQTLLADQVDQIKALEDRLIACGAQINQAAENLSEDQREILADALDDDGTSWKPAEVKKLAKTLSVEAKTDSDLGSCVDVLKDVQALYEEQAKTKKTLKTQKAQLHEAAKTTLENLDPDQTRQLLHAKWISPLADALHAIPTALVDELAKQLKTLCNKYETTLASLDEEIASCERELATMLDDLTANPSDMAGLHELRHLLRGDQP